MWTPSAPTVGVPPNPSRLLALGSRNSTSRFPRFATSATDPGLCVQARVDVFERLLRGHEKFGGDAFGGDAFGGDFIPLSTWQPVTLKLQASFSSVNLSLARGTAAASEESEFRTRTYVSA